MAIVYFDSSAFVKLVVEEDFSDLVAALWDGCDAAVSSRLASPRYGPRWPRPVGMDAVHLASALAVGRQRLLFATWDQRLRAAAESAGIQCVPSAADG